MITSTIKAIHGLVALLAFQQAPNPAFVSQMQADPIWSNSYVQTVEVRAAWGTIETADGKFDWSLPDAAVAKAKAAGRPCAISVTFGTYTPAWVYAAGAVKQTIHMNSGESQFMPWTSDPVLVAKEAAFIKALGARYDSNPWVSYVVMAGFGRQLESYVTETQADTKAFEAMSGETLWYTASGNLIADYAAAFPHTPLIMAIAPPTPDANGILALQNVVALAMQGLPNHFGIRSDGLRPGYDMNGPVAQFLQQYKSGITGFQFSLPAGSTPMSQFFAVSAKFQPRFIECFEGDVKNPAQTASLKAESASF